MDSTTAAKLIAIPSALFLGGYKLTFSRDLIPLLIGLGPPLSAPAFTRAYFSSLSLMLPTMLSSVASFGYLTYAAHLAGDKIERNCYAAAAVLVLGVGLTTKLVMLPGVERLLDINEQALWQGKEAVHEEVAQLLQAFRMQNWSRSAFGVAAGMVGLYAAVALAPKH